MKPKESTDQRLSELELSQFKQKIEETYKSNNIQLNFNVMKIQPLSNGAVALQVPSNEEAKEAVKQLNFESESLGYKASEGTKRNPRLMIKNIPSGFIPENIIESILNNNSEIKDTQQDANSTLKHIVTLNSDKSKTSSIVIEVSPKLRKIIIKTNKIKLGMCIYKIVDYIRILQCNNCLKYGHHQKNCNSEKKVCGNCSLDHEMKTCPLGLAEQKTPNMSSGKKCSNCCNHYHFKSHASSHGSFDRLECPSFKNYYMKQQKLTQYHDD